MPKARVWAVVEGGGLHRGWGRREEGVVPGVCVGVAVGGSERSGWHRG